MVTDICVCACFFLRRSNLLFVFRLAVALRNAGRLAEAKAAAENALKMDPGNEAYLNNLSLINESIKSAAPGASARPTPKAGNSASGERPTPPPPPASGMPAGGMPNIGMLSEMFNNPEFVNMAQTMMVRGGARGTVPMSNILV